MKPKRKPKPRNNLIRAIQETDPSRLRTRVVKQKRKPKPTVDDWGNEWSNVT